MTNHFTTDGRRLQAVEAGTAYASPDGRLVNVTSGMGALFSDDFGGSALDLSRWDVLDGGLGAVTLSTGPQGAIGSGVTGITDSVANSALTVAMGTTSGAERWYLSRAVFAGAEDITVILSRSQALAANSFFVGLVEVDLVTGYPVLNPNLAGDFANRGGVDYGKTTGASTAFVEAIGDGSGSVASVTSASFSPAAMTTAFETLIEFHAEDVVAAACAVDAVTGRGAALRVSTQCPNDGKPYKLIIRARNVSAPASNTNFIVQRVLLVDSQENRVEVTSGRGDTSAQKAIAVNVIGASATSSMVQGAYASNATGSTPNPVIVGAVEESAPRAAGTAGRTSNLSQSLEGQLLVRTGGFPASQDAGKVAITATTETTLVAAVASTRHELQALTIANRDSAAHTIDFRDAAAGTIRQVAVVPAGQTVQLQFPNRLAASAVNAAWTAQMRESATTAVEISYASYRTTA